MDIQAWQVFLFLIGIIIGLLQWAVMSMVKDVKDKVTMICTSNEKAHKSLWSRIHHHRHTDTGEVVVTGGTD